MRTQCSGSPGPCVWALIALRALTSEESFAPPALRSGKGGLPGSRVRAGRRRPRCLVLLSGVVGCVSGGARQSNIGPIEVIHHLSASVAVVRERPSSVVAAFSCRHARGGRLDALADTAAVDPKSTTTRAAIDRLTGQSIRSSPVPCALSARPRRPLLVSIAPAPVCP